MRKAKRLDNALKSADAVIAKLLAGRERIGVGDQGRRLKARITLRPDPMLYAAGVDMLLARKADLPFVLRLAADGKIAGERFIRENESSYKLDGKVLASLDRNAAAFADIAGWARFLQGDVAGAEARLAEAARLSRGLDPVESAAPRRSCRARRTTSRTPASTTDGARAGGKRPRRSASRPGPRWPMCRRKSGESPAEFEKWLAATLERKPQ